MTKFIKGLKLSEIFYKKAVRPILKSKFPSLIYSAALIGSGSEVLGYDTPLSMDHHWGARLTIFIGENDLKIYNDSIKETMSNMLPYEIKGVPTSFGKADKIGVQLLEKRKSGKINHHVYVESIESYFKKQLLIDPYKNLSIIEWLTIPQQKLLEVTSGKVFYDGLGKLNKIRSKLNYYPKDVWLYMLSAEWQRISQEEAFVGRCGDVGDELGSKVVASKIVTYLMNLSFLMERRYMPYTKWFGTGFRELKISKRLSPVLQEVLKSNNWKQRERLLSKAYKIVAEEQNKLKITKPIDTNVSKYHDRPYYVIHGDKFSEAIRSKIRDKSIKKIKLNVGSVDEFINNVDILSKSEVSRRLKVLYESKKDK